MNYLSLAANFSDGETYLTLSTPKGIFHCVVENIYNIHPLVQINDDFLIKLRDFINTTIDKKE